MSNDLLNEYGFPLGTAQEASVFAPGEIKSPMATQLPKPATYHLLCTIPDIEDKFENGILKAEKTMFNESVLTNVLFVVSLGPDAFTDTKRFPSGPSCVAGDFVLTRANTGTRFKIHGKEFRLIADESVEAVVQDPRSIQRVFI